MDARIKRNERKEIQFKKKGIGLLVNLWRPFAKAFANLAVKIFLTAKRARRKRNERKRIQLIKKGNSL